jgi:Domain of unknown function (DUF4112)
MSKIVVRPSPSKESALETLANLRRLSNLWDRALGIPGTKWRVGLDSVVGLLPVGGDAVGLLVSTYILWQVVQFGLPKTILVRMVFNVLLDALVGSVPLLGDLFDTAWKANTKNVNLLEAHLKQPQLSQKADRRFLVFVFGGLTLGLLGLTLLAATVLTLIFRALS